jgi:hypothetical protein
LFRIAVPHANWANVIVFVDGIETTTYAQLLVLVQGNPPVLALIKSDSYLALHVYFIKQNLFRQV